MRRRWLAIVLSPLLLAGMTAACDDATVPSTPASPPSASPATGATSADPADPAFASFRGRVQATPRTFLIRFVRNLALDVPNGQGAIRRTVAELRAWIDGERTWLAGHEGATCYGEAVTAYDAALDAALDVADAFDEVAAVASPPPDEQQAAVDAIEAASRAFDQAEQASRTAIERCR